MIIKSETASRAASIRAAARRFEDPTQGPLPPPDRRPRAWGDLSETERFSEARRRAAQPHVVK